MSLLKPERRPSGKTGNRTYSANADAARRATRARDHLERKRAQERRRRERERDQADRALRRTPLRSAVSLGILALATTAGIFAATPLNERALLPPSNVDRVDVLGASALTPEAIVRAAGLSAVSSNRDFDSRRIVEAIETEPWIESARALRLPTGTLVISVVERDAIAIWQIDSTSSALLVDQRGTGFDGALEPAGALPRITGESGTGETSLPPDALEILSALERFENLVEDPRLLTLYLPSTQGDDEAGYVLQLGDGGPRALLGRRLLRERVARLAALIESGEPSFLAARLIDLRYADRAVLRTEPVSG
jgi:cell division septal protein FtsQ